MSLYVGGMFAAFVGMLVGLLLFHHHKLRVVAIGFAMLTVAFTVHSNGIEPWVEHFMEHWVEHFMEHHRSHLLINLALLLPAFALVAYYFELSGASYGLAKVLKSDIALMWVVFLLSIILDNIAAALIGGTIVLAKYGAGNVPFRMLVGVIGASNLGGAGSPIGDTTTVMMFISEDPKISVLEIFMAFIATVPAQILLTWWAVRHDVVAQPSIGSGAVSQVIEEDYMLRTAGQGSADGAGTGMAEAEGLAGSQHQVQWSQMWPMLAIPGLIIGNINNQPGLGVWVGLVLGLMFAMRKFEEKVFYEALPNTGFLLLLVGAAEMLPLEEIKPILELLPRDVVAVLIGLLSAWFDNIPLTAVCLALKGFDWGLLAYCAGYGGSAMWFGSSAGVAMGLLFPEVYNTKKWLGWTGPLVVITGTYLAGAACYLLVKNTFPIAVIAFSDAPKWQQMMVCLLGTFVCWAGYGLCLIYPQKHLSFSQQIGVMALGLVGTMSLCCTFWIAAVVFNDAPKWQQMMVCLLGTFVCWAGSGLCWAYPQQRVNFTRKVGAMALGLAGAISLCCTFWVISLD